MSTDTTEKKASFVAALVNRLRKPKTLDAIKIFEAPDVHVVGRMNDATLLRDVIEKLPTSIFVKDADLKFVLANAACCELMGVTEDKLIGKTDLDFFAPENAWTFMSNDKRVIDGAEVLSFEEQVAPNGADEKSMLTRKVRLSGSDNKTYLVGTNTDLTKIKQREEAYGQLADNIPVGIFRIRDDMTVAFANKLGRNYLGFSEKPEDANAILTMFPDAPQDLLANACRFETNLSFADTAEIKSFLVISSGWLKRTGDTRRSSIISIVDVSAMNELQQINDEISRLNRELADNMSRLKDAQDKLVKRGRMEQLGQLTATVAHELRNPMGSVRTSTFLLERKLGDQVAPVQPQITRIYKGISRCDNIIAQLLDFSRTKRVDSKPEKLDEWLEGVLAEETRNLPSSLSVTCDLGLGDATVMFDKSRLQRAVINLIANAVEAMVGTEDNPLAKPTVSPQLSISTKFVGSRVLISIVDNGPGISHEIFEKIREPLFTTKNFGTGLGIPAVEQIAIQHDGELLVSSTMGEGASFTLSLPAHSENQAAEAAA
jgi:PAS domain S-box-containing protein